MQLKPEKKHLSWEEDYNPKNIIFKFNIYIYSNIHLHGYRALVTQLSKKRPFPTIEDSSIVSKIWSHNKWVCQHSAKNQLPLSIFQQRKYLQSPSSTWGSDSDVTRPKSPIMKMFRFTWVISDSSDLVEQSKHTVSVVAVL